MIPYYFSKIYKFNGKILSYRNGEYPYLEQYSPNLKINFIKKSILHKYLVQYCETNVLKYLIFNAKRIAFLNLIHPHEHNEIYGVLFKLLNRKGFLYLKMDVNEFFKEKSLNRWPYKEKKKPKGLSNYLKYQFKRKINTLFYELVDLISFESKELVEFFKIKYPKLRDKITYIPNGVDDFFIKNDINRIYSFKDKENIVLTVGRIGDIIKSNETLLEAIIKIKDLKDWKFVFIGSIKEQFKGYIKKYFKKYPFLKDRIIFVGEITERKRLYEFYQKSKIFCLTSLHESFGIVLVEAAYFGDFIVSSNFASARDITKNEKFGRIFNPGDSDKLANILQHLIKNEELLKENYQEIQKNAEGKYSWSKIIQKLYIEFHNRRSN